MIKIKKFTSKGLIIKLFNSQNYLFYKKIVLYKSYMEYK